MADDEITAYMAPTLYGVIICKSREEAVEMQREFYRDGPIREIKLTQAEIDALPDSAGP